MTISKEHHDIVIVGGGISGLWLAKQLEAQGRDFKLVSSDLNGGLLGQITLNGFTFELAGGHVYTTSDPRVSALMNRIDSRRISRKAFYRHEGRFIDYPVQDHASEIGIELNPRKNFTQEYSFQNLESYVLPIFGRQFTHDWFAPFNQRVWNVPIHQMDSDWVNGRVKVTKPIDNKWGSNAEFFYATGPSMFNEIKKSIYDYHMTRDVVLFPDIERKTLMLMSGSELSYNTLVWTPSLKFLLPQMRENHNEFEQNRLMNVCIGLNRRFDEMPDFHWYYPDVKMSRFHRVNKLSNYHQSLTPEGCDSLMLERTFKHLPPYQEDDFYKKTKFEQIGSWQRASEIDHQFAVQLLNEVGITTVTEKDIKVSMIVETPGYPIPTMGIRSKVTEIKQKLIKKDVILAGRFGSHAYFNIDHCMTEAEIIASIINDPIDLNKVHDYLWSSFYYNVYSDGKTPLYYAAKRVDRILEGD